MRRIPEHPKAFIYSACILAVALLSFSGCEKRERQYTTGQKVIAYKLPVEGFHGDEYYALVQSSALPGMHEDFKQVLFDQGGIQKWDRKYDCNHFAALYIALAQARWAVAAWQSDSAPQTLALAEFWYLPGGSGTTGHAIVAADTERGLIFIEPQTGQSINLTEAEKRSAYLVKW